MPLAITLGLGIDAYRRSRFVASSQSLYTALVAYWAMEGAAGTGATDLKGSEHLTHNAFGATQIGSAAGKVGACRQLASTSTQYFSRADDAVLSMGDIDFAVGLWVNITTKASNRGIIGKYVVSVANREWLLFWNAGTDRFNFNVSNNGTTVVSTIASTFGAPSLDTWYWVFCYHDSVANTIGISVNDGAVNTTAHTTGVFDGTAEFRIGSFAASNYLNGLVDEVAIWKGYIPSVAERSWIYNAGNGRSFSEIQSYAP